MEHFTLMADAWSIESSTGANAFVERNIAEETHPNAGWRRVANTHLADAEHLATFCQTIVDQIDAYLNSFVKLLLRHRWFIKEILCTISYLIIFNDPFSIFNWKIIVHTHIDDA